MGVGIGSYGAKVTWVGLSHMPYKRAICMFTRLMQIAKENTNTKETVQWYIGITSG